MRNRYVKNSCLFLGVLIIILFLLQKTIDFGVKKSNYAHYNKVNLIMNHRVDPEIAIFGSSVGEVGVNTPLLENIIQRSSYNFSIDGTVYMQYRGLINEFNQYSEKCKVIVFTETFFSLTSNDKLMEVDRYVAYINNRNIYQSLFSIRPELVWKLKHIPFYKFIVMQHSYYKASLIGLKNYLLGFDKPSDSLKGFLPKNASWHAGLDKMNQGTKPIRIQIDPAIVQKYVETIESLVKKGRKVLIILPPIHEEGLKLLLNYDEIQRTFARFKRDGVYFIDYTMLPIHKEKRYFYNNTHVNVEGAKAFSTQLGIDINGILAN